MNPKGLNGLLFTLLLYTLLIMIVIKMFPNYDHYKNVPVTETWASKGTYN